MNLFQKVIVSVHTGMVTINPLEFLYDNLIYIELDVIYLYGLFQQVPN